MPSSALQSGAAVLTQPAAASARDVPARPVVIPSRCTRRLPSGRAAGEALPSATASVREPATMVSVERSTSAALLAIVEAVGVDSNSLARST